MTRPPRSRLHTLLACAGLTAAGLLPVGRPAAPVHAASPTLTLSTTTDASAGPVSFAATTIPSWSGSFASNGQTYPYRMVGTNPALGSATTTIPVELIPLRFVFANGAVMDGSTKVRAVLASPLFQAAPFGSGTTQYGDAMLRAQNWATVATTSPDWHVLLGQPTVLPTQTIVVPQNLGYEFVGNLDTSGGSTLPPDLQNAPIGLVDNTWLDTEIHSLSNSLHLDPRTLPIFLGDNTGTTSKRDPASNGAMGEHGTFTDAANGTGVPPVQTYIYASYDTPHIYPAAYDGVQDITVLSHEVEEWMNDPFIQNATPAWDAPVYGCNNLLEVGDPALAETFPVAMPNRMTYHPQDEVFLPWFARSAPSGLNGAYDYMGAFTSYAPSC